MSRFFVKTEQISEGNIFITDSKDIIHLKNVLRAAPGDEVEISDMSSWEYKALIEEIEHDLVRLKIIDKQRFSREPEIKVKLYQGIPKSGKMEIIVQKCVELGIYRITPVYCARSVALWGKDSENKIARLNRVASESVKQCQRGIVPEVTAPMSFKEAVSDMKGCDAAFFPYENEEDSTIKDYLRGLKQTPATLAFIIGPEGGFSDEEADYLTKEGHAPVSLGRTVLRTETAAAATLATVMYELEL